VPDHRPRARPRVRLRRGVRRQALNTWCHGLELSGDGTDITESFELADTAALRLYWRLLGWARGRTNRNGMRTTLERMKAELEDR